MMSRALEAAIYERRLSRERDERPGGFRRLPLAIKGVIYVALFVFGLIFGLAVLGGLTILLG